MLTDDKANATPAEQHMDDKLGVPLLLGVDAYQYDAASCDLYVKLLTHLSQLAASAAAMRSGTTP